MAQSLVSRRIIQALAKLVGLLVGIKQKRPGRRLVVTCLAEGQGFEPWSALRHRRFSLPAIAFATRRSLFEVWTLPSPLQNCFRWEPSSLYTFPTSGLRSALPRYSPGASPTLTPYNCNVSEAVLDLTRPVHSTALPTFRGANYIRHCISR